MCPHELYARLMHVSACCGQKREPDPLELQVLVSCPMWALGAESSVRTLSPPRHRPSPAFHFGHSHSTQNSCEAPVQAICEGNFKF